MEIRANEEISFKEKRSEHAHFRALLNGGTVDGIKEKTIFKPGALKYAGATITWIHPLEYIRNLLTLPLWLGSLLAFVFYVVIVALFALLYYAGGDECTSASITPTEDGKAVTGVDFFDCWQLSLHTLSTVGYGSTFPVSNYCSIVSLCESFVSLLLAATLTGMIFSVIVRPRLRLRFGKTAVFVEESPGVWYFECRICRTGSELAALDVDARAAVREYTSDGVETKADMMLIRANQEILYEWTIRHRVTEHSPFHTWGLGTPRAARRDNYVISVIVSVLDAASNTRVTLLHNYLCDSVKMRHRLAPMWSEQAPKKTLAQMSCCEAFKYKLAHHAYRFLCMCSCRVPPETVGGLVLDFNQLDQVVPQGPASAGNAGGGGGANGHSRMRNKRPSIFNASP